MKRQLTKKDQIAIIALLLFLVVLCLAGEAYQKGILEVGREGVHIYLDRAEEVGLGGNSKTQTLKEKKIRILLMTDSFASLFHRKVELTSQKPFTVTAGGKKKQYKAGETASYAADSFPSGKKITCRPSDGGKIKIVSIKRQNIHPSYRGTLCLTWKKKGILIRNELSLEQYLYAVIPSELSTGNKMEALKAQAVCARSYAYTHLNTEEYKKYHADMDDSVAYQVYNNVPEDARSRKAADETRGLVLARGGKVVEVYYYSTSWGYSASGQDVWNTESAIPYLKSKAQATEREEKKHGVPEVDLSSEGRFQEFLKNPPFHTYDEDAAWYRWNVTIERSSLSRRVDGLLYSCYASDPELVLTQKEDGSYRKQVPAPLGDIRTIRVEKREKSGLVTELVLVGDKNVVKVCSQYNIRKVLAPLYESVSYGKGEKSASMSLLPSAAFYIQNATADNRAVFYIAGGGFGHGAGMSQCGAAGMAQDGKDYRDILDYYFEGAKVASLEKIAG